MAAPELNDKGIEFLQALSRRQIKFMIVGLSAAALPLARILASKPATNRMKDRLMIPVLEDALQVKGNT